MMLNKNSVFIVAAIILTFGGSLVQSECGKRLGKGVVMCLLGQNKDYQNFDFKLCTHAAAPLAISCDEKACTSSKIPVIEKALELARPHFPSRMGFYMQVDSKFEKVVSPRLSRFRIAQSMVQFMVDAGFSFMMVTELIADDFPRNNTERNTILYMQEISQLLHDRGFHIGLNLLPFRSDFQGKYDIAKLSEHIDWFTISVGKSPYLLEKRLEAYAPLSSSDKNDTGSAQYWFDYMRKLVPSECFMINFNRAGIKYIPLEAEVEPGVNSHAETDDPEIVVYEEICQRLLLDSSCREFWDEESSTPWTTCGDDFYTYDNPKSIELKVKLAREYKLAGVSFVDVGHPEKGCGAEDKDLFLQVLQKIRTNSTDADAVVAYH